MLTRATSVCRVAAALVAAEPNRPSNGVVASLATTTYASAFTPTVASALRFLLAADADADARAAALCDLGQELSAEDLAVLGEALKCCGVKAARQLVADVEKEAAEK